MVESRRAEDGKAITLDAQADRPGKFGPRKNTRVVDGRKAYTVPEMRRRLASSGEQLDEFPWHTVHTCRTTR